MMNRRTVLTIVGCCFFSLTLLLLSLFSRPSLAMPETRTEPLSAGSTVDATALQEQAAKLRVQAFAITDDDVNTANDYISTQAVEQNTSANATAQSRTVGAGCTYSTIGAAISASTPGDTLYLEGGATFTETLAVSKDLTIIGGYPGCDSGSSAWTTIDGGGSAPVVSIAHNKDVTLESLYIINGNSTGSGGGIYVPSASGALITLSDIWIYENNTRYGAGMWFGSNVEVHGTNLLIYDNVASDFGGAVRLYEATAVFTDVYITDNIADMGAGIYATKGGGAESQVYLYANSGLTSNDALTGDGLGGGIYVKQGSIAVQDTVDLVSNQALIGGGVYMISSTLTISGTGASVDYNDAVTDGGGVWAVGSTITILDDAEVYGNEAGNHGGGLYLDNSNLKLNQGDVSSNSAMTGNGGGIYAVNGSTVAFAADLDACTVLQCSRLANNTANGYGGAAFALNSTIGLTQTWVMRNSASQGGGLYLYESNTTLDTSVIAENEGNSAADGIYLDRSDMVASHITMAKNDDQQEIYGTAIGLDSGASSLTMSNSIIWAHAIGIDRTGQSVTCSDIQGGYTGTGNLNIDPQFDDAFSGFYLLLSSSPVIDRCATGTSPDIEQVARPFIAIRPDTPYDMGADEVTTIEPTPTPTATSTPWPTPTPTTTVVPNPGYETFLPMALHGMH